MFVVNRKELGNILWRNAASRVRLFSSSDAASRSSRNNCSGCYVHDKLDNANIKKLRGKRDMFYKYYRRCYD